MLCAAMRHQDSDSLKKHGPKMSFYANTKTTTQLLFPQILLYNYMLHTINEIQAVVAATYIPPKDRSYFRYLKSLKIMSLLSKVVHNSRDII